MVAVSIAKERTPAELRALARRERDGRVGSRLLALANALDGMSRGVAARAAGMDRQTLRDWVHRYNAVYGRSPLCKGFLGEPRRTGANCSRVSGLGRPVGRWP